jgi:hypothetical protein
MRSDGSVRRIIRSSAGRSYGAQFARGARGEAIWRTNESGLGRRKGERGGGAGVRKHRIQQAGRLGGGKDGVAKGQHSLFAGAARFQEPARHPGFDLRRDPFLHEVTQLLAKVGDAIQPGKLESFERCGGAFQKVVERRGRFAHRSASKSDLGWRQKERPVAY